MAVIPLCSRKACRWFRTTVSVTDDSVLITYLLGSKLWFEG
jgi:hypothetical protein